MGQKVDRISTDVRAPSLRGMDFSTTKDVREYIERCFYTMFPEEAEGRLPRFFDLVEDMFAGRYPGYQSMDTAYHDLGHTMQATLCFVYLVFNHYREGVEPALDASDFERGLFSILLHDIGYLKEITDTTGTGAKYTHVHEKRSCTHARRILSARKWREENIACVENLISCTGPLSDVTKIPFQNEAERFMGQAVCTADFIGQMSDPGYPAKLSVLFVEFEESYTYQGIPRDKWPFDTYEKLLRGTPGFWKTFVRHKMEAECDGVWRFLRDPVTGQDVYMDAVEENMRIIGEMIQEFERRPALAPIGPRVPAARAVSTGKTSSLAAGR